MSHSCPSIVITPPCRTGAEIDSLVQQATAFFRSGQYTLTVYLCGQGLAHTAERTELQEQWRTFRRLHYYAQLLLLDLEVQSQIISTFQELAGGRRADTSRLEGVVGFRMYLERRELQRLTEEDRKSQYNSPKKIDCVWKRVGKKTQAFVEHCADKLIERTLLSKAC
ncbi:hypothetical protein PWT90_03563 [Aphanocladium album]|nr:hypothetical protein PWT90_03563 [Aphanocladium album]